MGILILIHFLCSLDLLVDRPENYADRDEEEYVEDRSCEERAEALVLHDASSQICLKHVADEEAENKRCRRQLELAVEVTDNAEDHD